MTNDFANELKTKQGQGLLKPSDFKKNKDWTHSTITNEQVNPQSELNTTKQNCPNPQSEIANLKAQNNALELALFEKRLENLNQFSHYRERLKQLRNQEIKLTLDENTQLVFSLLTLALFINLLTK
ncbi:MAG: hypothetical protein GBAus27B_000273 [Mycoplasmataceae bacterium]|nr:MAG: hypothetical protein GBAus27B_000273 [Mycoplasmataceae bacterium]